MYERYIVQILKAQLMHLTRLTLLRTSSSQGRRNRNALELCTHSLESRRPRTISPHACQIEKQKQRRDIFILLTKER